MLPIRPHTIFLLPQTITPAQYYGQLTYDQLPFSLRDLVERGKVSAQWALALPVRRQCILGNQNVCDLIADGIIRPSDVASNFGYLHLSALNEKPTVRELLKDGVISARQFAGFEVHQLGVLIDPAFQAELRRTDNQEQMKAGSLTVEDLMIEFDYEPSVSSTFKTNPPKDDGDEVATTSSMPVPTVRTVASGALNFVASTFLGKQASVKTIQQAKQAGAGAIRVREDGATVYCINLKVLAAIKEIITHGQDSDTIAIILDNALRYGYQDVLATVIQRCNKNLLSWDDNSQMVEAVTNRLEGRGLKLSLQSDGGFRLSELATGPVSQLTRDESLRVLDQFLPRDINTLIISRYQDGLSFDVALARRHFDVIEKFKKFPLALSYIKKTFNDGIIGSDYIDRNLSVQTVEALHHIILRQSQYPSLKVLLNNQRKIMLDLSYTMLQYLYIEHNPCALIDRREIVLADLLKIDTIFKVRNTQYIDPGLFRTGKSTKEWIHNHRLWWQANPDEAAARSGAKPRQFETHGVQTF